MGTRTIPFDSADYLSSEADVVDWLKIWMEDGSPEEVASAIGEIARSKGMSEIVRKTGLGRQAQYNALSEKGNPTLETLMSVLDALGLQLTVQRKAA